MSSKNIYIAACSKNGGVYHCRLNSSGELIIIGSISLDRPMYLAAEGDVLYALLRSPFEHSEYSGIVSIELNESGELCSSSVPVSTMGQVAAHLCVLDGQLYAANYISGSIIKMPNQLAVHTGCGPNPARQESSHPHFICFTPDNEFIATVDLGTDTIYIYTKQLELISTVKVPAGNGCRHLAFSPDGKYAYCVNELSSDVCVFSYERGHLVLLETVPGLPHHMEGSTSAAIRCTESRLYISHRGYDRISEYRRENAKLKHIADIPCGGNGPRDFDLLESFIISTNEKSDNVSVIRDGIVVSSLTLPSPIAVLIR